MADATPAPTSSPSSAQSLRLLNACAGACIIMVLAVVGIADNHGGYVTMAMLAVALAGNTWLVGHLPATHWHSNQPLARISQALWDIQVLMIMFMVGNAISICIITGAAAIAPSLGLPSLSHVDSGRMLFVGTPMVALILLPRIIASTLAKITSK